MDGEARAEAGAEGTEGTAGAQGRPAPPDTSRFRRLAAGFSRSVLRRRLRPYQEEIAGAVLHSVHNQLGLTFTVVMARQMGKNELSAHLEAGLLARNAREGATLVKAAPTFRPQVTTSLQRLESLLKQAQQHAPITRRDRYGKERVVRPKKENGYQLALDPGRISFLSADPAASVVGATASLLLELDEAQDVDPEKFTRDFRPMASSTNATTVLWGTAWTQDTLLEQQKQTNVRLEAEDGIPRHFEFDWTHGAAENPHYGTFVRGEVGRLGEEHPLIRTQYLLLPLAEAGSFFTSRQRQLLRGEHGRRTAPVGDEEGALTGGTEGEELPESFYVAGVDVAGPAEEAQDADHLLRALKPRKDSTVVLIAEVTPLPAAEGSGGEGHPMTRIVQAYWWTGRPLHEQCDLLVTLLKHTWRCGRVVVDASGLGLDLATRLERALGEEVVERFVFSVPSKSELAYGLLGHVNSGRLAMWSEEGGGAEGAVPGPRGRTRVAAGSGVPVATSPEAAEFWRVVERARPIHRVGGAGAPRLGFYVPEHYGHDDFLVALALVSRAAREAAVPVEYVPPLSFMVGPRGMGGGRFGY